MYTWKEATDIYMRTILKGLAHKSALDVSSSFPVKLEMRCVFFKWIPVKDNEMSKARMACTKLFCLTQVEHLRRAS